MPKQKHKHKKFSRSKEIGNFKLQVRDIEIIRQVYEFRFLDTAQILALHKGGKTNLQRRLQLLYHHQYLDRPVQQQTAYFRPGGRRQHIIYALGKRGAEMLAERFTKDGAAVTRGRLDWQKQKSVNWQQKNAGASFPFLWHQCMLNDFIITLDLALRSVAGAKLKLWENGEAVKQYVRMINTRGREGRVPVVPDACVVISNSVNKDETEELPFFIEVDRSTMTLSRFKEKIAAYETLFKENRDVEKFGIPLKRFRVLTVTISTARRDNLREFLAESGLFTKDKTTGELKGSRRYLFACDKDFILEKPRTILDARWYAPMDAKGRALLE